MNLTVDDFPTFYQAVHGADRDPFPWQRRLAKQVAEGAWPEVLAMATSSGKTSLIDIAVFALALQSGRPRNERNAPLRIFFIIDRRIVVDEAAEHAQRLASELQKAREQPEAADPVLREVASRLSNYSGGRSVPLQVVALRGGMYRDESWTGTPSAPTVCLSTVDQIGSRLLFRGYGLSEYQWPIHAGLIGSDALLILDEAHLSNPFWETLQAVRRYQGWTEQAVTQPWRVVQMTATPNTNSKPFRLEDEDYQHKVLGKRLIASKVATLVEAAAGQFEITVVEQARDLAKNENAQVIGIVVNRVASARQIFEALRQDEQVDAILLTGRIRPFDRDRLLEEWLEKMRAGRTRAAYADGKKLYVVATQTIEVGANLDFDALVTEAATLDALRQRFGRLDRLGELVKTLACVVLRPPEKDEDGKEKIDPIYGEALLETWDLLKRMATSTKGDLLLDFGVVALDATVKAAKDAAIKNAPFKPEDLNTKFIAKLCEKPKSKNKADPLILHLNGLLPEELRAELERVNEWKPDQNDKVGKKEKERATKAAIKALAGELNDLLKASLLFNAQAFEKVNLSDETSEKLASESNGEELVFMNRRLLEEAFPQEIKKQPGLAPRRRNHAPILFPAHLDSWVQTSPAPQADPDPALFLHGRDALGCADVQIVWRADLDDLPEKKWVEVVALAPPVVREALPVPLWIAQAWLTQIAKSAQTESMDLADIEGVAGESQEPQKKRWAAHNKGSSALRWRGPEKDDSQPIKPDEIVPGDTLVVPSRYGGADKYGWHPSSPDRVRDIGDECANQIAYEFAVSAFKRRPYRLRLDVDRLRALVSQSALNSTEEPDELTDVTREEINELLLAYRTQAESSFNLLAAEAMLEAPDKARKLAPYPDGTLNRIVLTMRPKKREAQSVKSVSTAALESSDDHTDGDDTASVIGVRAPLRAHCACVGKWARRFAEQCGLPQELIEDLEFAGRLHDLGKADRRFQIWLHDGDEIAESQSLEPLAKSGMQPNNRAAIRAARKRAGYPKGGRHELLSVALVNDNDALKAKAHDWELVLHLVGTHHGYGRPFPPVVFDLKPETVTVEVESQLDRIGLLITERMKNEKATGDFESQSLTASSDHGLERLNSGWVERFWRLVRRYGVWGLAYLEALLRLADYARSAEERNLYDK